MPLCQRSSSSTAFRRRARELLKLWRLLKNIQCYNRTLVESSLRQLLARISSPALGGILISMGACDALIPLLTLKSSKKQILISLTLSILSILALTGEHFLATATNPIFCSLLHDFLKSKSTEQKLAGRIVCNMFRQMPVGESILIRNDACTELLIMSMRLPFMSTLVFTLKVFEELTYHSENVKILLNKYSSDNELCFLSILMELVISDQEDLQIPTLRVILNCLTFIDDPIIKASVLHHSLHIEDMLVNVSFKL